MTQFIGFKKYGEEYKMMGLAAYGKPKYFEKIRNNLFINEPKSLVKLNLKYFNHQKPGYKYIAEDNLEIDQIYEDKLNDLFLDEINSEDSYEDFQKNFAKAQSKKFTNFILKK